MQGDVEAFDERAAAADDGAVGGSARRECQRELGSGADAKEGGGMVQRQRAAVVGAEQVDGREGVESTYCHRLEVEREVGQRRRAIV